MPLISVVIPVYNVEKYLPQCIESVAKQSFRDIEIIAVDDGSKDKSGEICDEYAKKDDRIKVIHKQNGGSSEARNAGIKAASGKYIMFLDSDDWWQTNGELEKIAERMRGELSPDVIGYSSMSYSHENNHYYKVCDDIDEKKARGKSTDVLEYLLSSDKMYGAAWLTAVKRSVIERNDIKFICGITAEDYDWNCSLAYYAKSFDYVKEYLVVYRKFVEGSVTSKKSARAVRSIFFTADKWQKLMDGKEQAEEKIIKCIIGRALISTISMIGYLDEKKELLKEFKHYDDFMKTVAIPRYRGIYKIYKIFGYEVAFLACRIGRYIRRRKIHGI